MTRDRAKAIVEYANLVGKLKTTPRTGWVRRGVPNYESVADHSWRMAALCFLLPRDEYDVSKCLSMAVVHDMAEAIVGDIAPDDNVSKKEKQERELAAMKHIVSILQGTEESVPSKSDSNVQQSTYLMDLFHEYEERTSKESVAVKDLDQLDMVLQADEYETEHDGLDLGDFFQSTPAEGFRIPELIEAAKEVHRRRAMRLKQTVATRKENEQAININSSSEAMPSVKDMSQHDQDFMSDFCSHSDLDPNTVETVIRALRNWEEKESTNR